MAHCNLCNKNTRCSCKGGGCPGCNSTNKQVSFINDLIKIGLSKEDIRKDLKTIRGYVDKVDTFTIYEYYSGQITEEEFNEALKRFEPKKASMTSKREVTPFKAMPNPNKTCVYDSSSPWARCKKCNSIKKYMEGKECPMYVENIKKEGGETPVNTVDENK